MHYHRCGVYVLCLGVCLYVIVTPPCIGKEAGNLEIYNIRDNYPSKGMWRWGTIVWLGVHRPDQRSYEREGRERSGG